MLVSHGKGAQFSVLHIVYKGLSSTQNLCQVLQLLGNMLSEVWVMGILWHLYWKVKNSKQFSYTPSYFPWITKHNFMDVYVPTTLPPLSGNASVKGREHLCLHFRFIYLHPLFSATHHPSTLILLPVLSLFIKHTGNLHQYYLDYVTVNGVLRNTMLRLIIVFISLRFPYTLVALVCFSLATK